MHAVNTLLFSGFQVTMGVVKLAQNRVSNSLRILLENRKEGLLHRFASFRLVSAAPTSRLFLFFPSLRLSLCPCHYVLSSVFRFTLNFMADLAGTVFSLFIRLQWTPSHYSRETTRLMSWPDRERSSRPLQSLAASLPLPLVSTLLGLEAYRF